MSARSPAVCAAGLLCSSSDSLVGPAGLEPATSSTPRKRATTCATARFHAEINKLGFFSCNSTQTAQPVSPRDTIAYRLWASKERSAFIARELVPSREVPLDSPAGDARRA